CRLKARQHIAYRFAIVGDGIADASVGYFLDCGGDGSDLARAEFLDLLHLRREETDALDLISGIGPHHPDALTLLERAIDDPHQHHHAEIDVVPGVDQQRL